MKCNLYIKSYLFTLKSQLKIFFREIYCEEFDFKKFLLNIAKLTYIVIHCAQCEKTRNSLPCKKYLSSNQYRVKFYSEKVALTEFLQQNAKCGNYVRNFSITIYCDTKIA